MSERGGVGEGWGWGRREKGSRRQGVGDRE